jgi:hypothetical protein
MGRVYGDSLFECLFMAQILGIDDLDDDLLLQILTHIRTPQQVALVGAVNRRLRELTASDMLWRELCIARWRNRLEAAPWMERGLQTMPRDADGRGHWRAQFALREHEVFGIYPVFMMGGRLKLGVETSIHFFEPRYRRLVQIALSRDQRFVFAVHVPVPGSIAYLCELHNVLVHADGCADVQALPVGECMLHATNAYETISPVHPPLLWCTAEVLPLPSEAALAAVKVRQHLLSGARRGGPLQYDAVALGGDEDGGEEEEEDALEEEEDGEDEDEDEEDEDDESEPRAANEVAEAEAVDPTATHGSARAAPAADR